MCIFLVWNLRHDFAVVNRRWRNVHVCRNLRFNVIQRVHLDSAFVLAEFGPPEHVKTQVNGSRIKGVDVAIEVKNLGRSLLTCQLDHVKCEVLEDAIVTILVRFREIAARHAFPHSEMVKLAMVGLKSHNQVTQSITITQLTEHHCEQLIPASGALYISVSVILRNNSIKLASIKKVG